MPPVAACAALALLLAVCPGCLAADGWGRFDPFASFESRCEALPDARIDVEAKPITFDEDVGRSYRTLSRMGDDITVGHRTIGLTQARLGYESTLESKALEDRRAERVCTRPNIRVVLSATPMTVYIAREFADDACRRAAIRDHEMKHVAVYRDYLQRLVPRLQRELKALFDNELVYARSAKALEEAMRTKLQVFMHGFLQARYGELKAKQGEVDTPEEYARLERACSPEAPGSP